MKFSGRLQIEADPRNWVKTDLNLSQGRLELVSGGDVLGSWSTAQVKAERVEGDKFQLHLGNDRLIFAADDALAFSYEALPVLAKKSVLAVAGGLRVKLRKGLAAPERPVHVDVPSYVEPAAAPHAVDIDSEPVEEVMPTRKLRDLIQAAVKNNAGGAPSPEAGDWSRPPSPSEPIARAQDAVEDRFTFQPEPKIFERQADRLADRLADPLADRLADSLADPEAVVPEVGDEAAESIVEDPVADLAPRIEADVSPDPPAFGLSPGFITVLRARQPNVEGGASNVLSQTGGPFENGETLGERPAGGLTPKADEANHPKIPPPPRAFRSLVALADDVRSAGLSPAQTGAVTDLIRALADSIEDSVPEV